MSVSINSKYKNKKFNYYFKYKNNYKKFKNKEKLVIFYPVNINSLINYIKILDLIESLTDLLKL